jgi:hypothetical protein
VDLKGLRKLTQDSQKLDGREKAIFVKKMLEFKRSLLHSIDEDEKIPAKIAPKDLNTWAFLSNFPNLYIRTKGKYTFFQGIDYKLKKAENELLEG